MDKIVETTEMLANPLSPETLAPFSYPVETPDINKAAHALGGIGLGDEQDAIPTPIPTTYIGAENSNYEGRFEKTIKDLKDQIDLSFNSYIHATNALPSATARKLKKDVQINEFEQLLDSTIRKWSTDRTLITLEDELREGSPLSSKYDLVAVPNIHAELDDVSNFMNRLGFSSVEITEDARDQINNFASSLVSQTPSIGSTTDQPLRFVLMQAEGSGYLRDFRGSPPQTLSSIKQFRQDHGPADIPSLLETAFWLFVNEQKYKNSQRTLKNFSVPHLDLQAASNIGGCVDVVETYVEAQSNSLKIISIPYSMGKTSIRHARLVLGR